MNLNSVAIELSELVVKLRAEERKTLEQVTEAQEQLQLLKHQREAVETTIRLCHNGAETNIDVRDALVAELREAKALGKTQQEGLDLIVDKHNGHLKATLAHRLLVDAGFFSNPKNAASMIYTLIGRAGKYGWIKPGEYRLLNAQEIDERQGFSPTEWEEKTKFDKAMISK